MEAKQEKGNVSWQTSIGVKGEYNRKDAQFRNCVTADGASGFKAEAGRYHLYISLACPWCHRVDLVSKLKGLEAVLPTTVVDWNLNSATGWAFTDKKPKCSLDPVNHCKYIREIYLLANPDYEGSYTVPVMWDKHKKTIVSNESSEIIRMLNTEFNEFCASEEQRKLNFYPESLRTKIDAVNEWIYPCINNGVYRSGFARKQEAYDVAVRDVFHGLDKVEDILSQSRYLIGDQLTEADIRLFVTLVRFDTAYVGHFKCNKKRVIDYPNLWGYVRDIYQMAGVAETCDQEHIQKHYQGSHLSINPFGIIAIGPDIDFNKPHNRTNMSK